MMDLNAEEQNGFKKGRSCFDHVFVLSTIIKHKIKQKSNLYVAFVDMVKSFDWIDRDMLLYKLLKI